jgi:hypothetical protein
MRPDKVTQNLKLCRTVRLRLVQLAADDGATMSSFVESLIKAEDARRIRRAKKTGAA